MKKCECKQKNTTTQTKVFYFLAQRINSQRCADDGRKFFF